MKKLISRAIVSFAILSTQAQAASLKGGLPACVSEELFDQLSIAAANKDQNAWKYLLKNGCIITKAGISITVLDSTWSGKTKVRVYVGDQAVILWTNTENIIR